MQLTIHRKSLKEYSILPYIVFATLMSFSILIFFILFIFFLKYYDNTKQYIIVTGASANHELSLIQFIYHCFNNNKKNIIIVVWDLGFSKVFLNKFKYILKRYNNIIYKIFNYTHYPSYFDINRRKGEYAWKPIIINITFYMMKRTLLWLDSGCIVNDSLYKVFHEINHYQCLSIFSSGTIKKWTHIGMIEYYNISNNIVQKRTCNGALVGFKWNSKISKIILNEWVECALIRTCIAPKGSNRKNHRQDQSALSILLYKNNIFENCPINRYSIIIHRDTKNVSLVKMMLKILLYNSSNYLI